jgi:hypothetical protein
MAGARNQAPKLACRAVAQHRFWPSSKCRSHPAGLNTKNRVADGVDAAMDWVQPATQSLVNRPSANARGQQLPTSCNPMLSFRQLGKYQVRITRAAFAPNSVVNAALVHPCDAPGGDLGHRPMLAGFGARVGR